MNHLTPADIAILDDLRAEIDDTTDMVRLVELRLRLSDLVSNLAENLSTLNDKLTARMGDGTEQHGPFIVRREWVARRRQWRSADLYHDVLPHILYDSETGEARDAREAVSALGVVYGLSGYAASLQALRRLGIDPDDYCEKSGSYRVEII